MKSPGPMPPIFTGFFAASHCCKVAMPVRLLKVQVLKSRAGAPRYSNLRTSYSTPGRPMT